MEPITARQSLLLVAPRRLVWVEEPLPALGPRDLLVQTRFGAVSVGTELPLYAGTHRGTNAIRYPKMTGYESFAEVIACGSDVQRFHTGDWILATYGHRTHALLHEERAIPVPPTISPALALLAILSCDVAKGIRKVDPQSDETVLIAGAGTIGLLTIFNLVACRISPIDVVEPVAARRELALALGARTALSPEDFLNSEGQYPVGFECSSRNQAFSLLQRCMAANGRICILADGNLEALELSPAFHEKELRVVGSSDGDDYPGHTAWFLRHAAPHAAILQRLYESRVHRTQLPHLFEKMADNAQSPIKVLVDYT